MELDASGGEIRLLAVFCNQEEECPGYDPPGKRSTPTFVTSRAGAKVRTGASG